MFKNRLIYLYSYFFHKADVFLHNLPYPPFLPLSLIPLQVSLLDQGQEYSSFSKQSRFFLSLSITTNVLG